MNYLDKETRKQAETQAVFCIYSYLLEKAPPAEGEYFSSAAARLWDVPLTEHERGQLEVIENSLFADSSLPLFTVGDYVISDGLNVCTFISPEGEISVVFRGTGKDEWLDNGEGLSGIPRKNTYYTYDGEGNTTSAVTVIDYSTARQAEALNWFNMTAARYGWTENTLITVSGHSKGGNKAQFISVFSQIVDLCISFDGQGFSPEAIDFFTAKLGSRFERRRERIKSLSAYNDYINVLGERVCKDKNVFFFACPMGDTDPVAYHYPEAILDRYGHLNEEREQGYISEYIEAVSDDLEAVAPHIRQYAVLGIAGIAARLLGAPKESDLMTSEDTAIGIGIAATPIISKLLGTRNGYGAIGELVQIYGRGARQKIYSLFDRIGDIYSPAVKARAIVVSCAAVSYAAPFAKSKKLPDPCRSKELFAEKLKEADRDIYLEALPILL